MNNTVFFSFQHFHLVGIKGVAMTSLAQCLIDAGKIVTGSDTAETFVTQPILDRLQLKIDDFSQQIPVRTECVIYTAAHQAKENPQVMAALELGLPCLSQAEALSYFFNLKKGIAVCGVGGKSTVSAMISWIMAKAIPPEPSFSVGVGSILGWDKSGQWSEKNSFFVAEADEYVIDPKSKPKVPRFTFLDPWITVCTNLEFDHPDVYEDFEDTTRTFHSFFQQIKTGGYLLINQDNVPTKAYENLHTKVLSYGTQSSATYKYTHQQSQMGQTKGELSFDGKSYPIVISQPGEYNLANAVAAIAACHLVGIELATAIEAIASFQSTARRFQNMGQFQGSQYYDDYAHHPQEIAAVLTALNDWYPQKHKVAIFQPHTYSRTKLLFNDFVSSLSLTDEVILLDIFASAREQDDPTISSQLLVEAIKQQHPQQNVHLIHTIAELAEFLKTQVKPDSVVLTLGAGDIYKVYQLLNT